MVESSPSKLLRYTQKKCVVRSVSGVMYWQLRYSRAFWTLPASAPWPAGANIVSI